MIRVRLGLLLVGCSLLMACPDDLQFTQAAVCDGRLQQSEDDVVDSPFDLDGDGFFDGNNSDCAAFYSAELLDCNDSEAGVHPGASELLCNGLDDDCDAASLDEVDGDGDGVGECSDCDDADPGNFPGNEEFCDGLDSDCIDGADMDSAGEVDADADGVLSCEDCRDDQPTVFPGATELCDGLDNDCANGPDFDLAGEVNADLDSAISCADCNDFDATVEPGAAELCDGQDNDCNGLADFGPGGEADSDGDGFWACEDCDDLEASVYIGAPELCTDLLDNDCDAAVDCFDPDCLGGPSCLSIQCPNGTIDVLANGELESGSLAPWVSNGTVTVEAAAARSGNFGVSLLGPIWLRQDIAPVPVAALTDVSFWSWHDPAELPSMQVMWGYADGSSDFVVFGEQALDGWQQSDILPLLDPTQELAWFFVAGYTDSEPFANLTHLDDLRICRN